MPTDVVLLGVDWNPRALLRAELIESGLDVVAVDTWQSARAYLRPGIKPRLVIIDLQSLPNPDEVLDALAILMKPDRVMVLTAAATVARGRLARTGFRVVRRPITVGEIAAEAQRLVRRQEQR